MSREELTYNERVNWFFQNYYSTGMEQLQLLEVMAESDLDNFEWYGKIIKIPKYKDEV